jgi:molybdate transport system ATP-binding protein
LRKAAVEDSLHVDVQKRYSAGSHSRFQLQVAFTVRPGVTILVGHSGAGKTTLLRAIAGLCDPDKGRIVIAGRTLFDSEQKIKIEPAKRKVAFVFQDLALFPHLTVQENVSYGLRKIARAERESRVAEILNSFQIAKLCNRMPREISGGEQQRVALARSLVTEPSVLLLDEPLSSLDAHTKASLIEDLRAWNEAHQIPILYVTHNHEEVFALGEHAISLEQGGILAQGSPVSVVTPYRQSMTHLVGFENLFEGIVVGSEDKPSATICRVAGTSIEIQLPQVSVTPGSPIHVGIKADEILLALSRPSILSACNLIQGSVKQLDDMGTKVEARIDAGVEFRVHLPACPPEFMTFKRGDNVWMMIRPQSCHLIRSRRMRATQRLFVFICNRNTSRSPMAAAICNAEIARRLKVSPERLTSMGVHAVSAGLAAREGDSMAAEAQEALNHLQVPVPAHRAQNFTAELAANAEFIFCMTESQRLAVINMFPQFGSKTLCLDPTMEIEAPHLEGEEEYLRLARQVQKIMHPLVDRILTPVEISESA